eukprot:gnl/MRDRNA2_/MRDRNA2_56669_c0_seq1.p1 gnl/MRDRNA2_/MRDRNA2_56669_c0~~gnl/MRDRNA2_/MRDRNA2_56669_c0_seq1.p1  ORF type:complete len:630 (+),score=118.66 gnl/MRDRNA2_/MRDRNA2_56669_c0_seq1:252-1892(+)
MSVVPEFASPVKLKIQIPPGSVPGVTQLQVDPGSGQEVIRVKVPEHLHPGNFLHLVKPHASLGWKIDGPSPEAGNTSRRKNIELIDPILIEGCCERMIAAARDAGAFVSPKIERGSAAPLWIPGLIAVDAVEEGEILIELPASLHLSPATFESILPGLFKAIRKIPPEVVPGDPNDRALAVSIACLLNLHSTALEDGSLDPSFQENDVSVLASVSPVWHRYAETLLGEDFSNHPNWMFICAKERLFQTLEPSEEAEVARTAVTEIINVSDLIWDHAEEDIPSPGYGIGNFLHARLCLISRKFGTPHGNALLPVVDLMNHSHHPGAVVAWNDAEQKSVVRALRPHSAGEEIFIMYEALSNPMALRQYGFTMPPEKEAAWTFASKIRKLHEQKVPGPWESLIGRITLLELNSGFVTRSLSTTFQQCVTQGLDLQPFWEKFLVQKMDAYEKDALLQPAITALQNVRKVDVSSASWWKEIAEGTYQKDQELGVRVKMSEYLCLTVHLEALRNASGSLPSESCLGNSETLRKAMQNALKTPSGVEVSGASQ